MLQTRLWMGTILVLVTAAMLVLDQWLAPWFPFLFVFVMGLSLAACKELVDLLGSARKAQGLLLYIGVALLGTSNWWAHVPHEFDGTRDAWHLILGVFVVLVLAAFLWEIATFQIPDDQAGMEGGAIERMARTI